MRYYIIAGEASGDLHGSNLMKGLYAADPDAVIRFRGGVHMENVYSQLDRSGRREAGLAFDYKEGAVMGFLEVLQKARKLIDELNDCKEDIFEFSPDALILIDYPGFNLKIAEWAHKLGFKVYYYIAPKVWASREYRIGKIKKYVDHLFIVFPFEQEFFKRHNVPFTYCGNPLVDAVECSPAFTRSREEFLQEVGLDPSCHTIAMLAGSRLAEVKTMMPLFRKTAAILHANPIFKDYKFIIAGAPGRKRADYGEIDESYMKIVFGYTQQVVRHSEAAAINSGTASLEALLLDTPQVVVYKTATRLTYLIARLIVKVKYISLGNLCLNRLAFKEFYTYEDCTPENVSQELTRLVCDLKYRSAMMEDYASVKAALGGRGASEAVASKMVNMLKNSK